MNYIRKWRENFELDPNPSMNDDQIRKFYSLLLEEVFELGEELFNVPHTFVELHKYSEFFKICRVKPDINLDNTCKEFIDVHYILEGEGEKALGLLDIIEKFKKKVYLSNMSKLVDTETDAVKSCTSENLHLKDADLPFAEYRQLENGKFVILRKIEGSEPKILKGINYKSYKEF